jgi:RHS repeat-associated protein
MGEKQGCALSVMLAAVLAFGIASPVSASLPTSPETTPPISAASQLLDAVPPALPSPFAASLEMPSLSPGARICWPRTPTGPRSYFGARYYGSRIGRFTTVDPLMDQRTALVDPQQWNRYAYGRNNPLRYVDPDGRAIETPWDALNVGIGVASFAANVAAGNVGGAVVDALGIAYDATATAVPVLPGGAGTAIRAARAADKAHAAAAALIAANRAAGKAAEAKIALEVAEEGGKVLGSQVCCRTSLGRRVVDHVVEEAGGRVAAIEAKSGNATRSAVQRAKDAEIAAGRGTFVGKNAPRELRGQQRAVETIERKPRN